MLSVLQNGTKPARADLNIIDSLSKDYNLANPVINVVIDFVLTMNNNVFSKYSAEKIAASLSRENVETAVDAMEYLRNNYTKDKKKGVKKSEVKVEEAPTSNKQVEESSIDDDELMNFFEDR